MDSANKILASLIANRRRELGFSQEELAEKAGIHRTYVSQLERGIKAPTINVLLEICRALELPASELIAQLEERIDGLRG